MAIERVRVHGRENGAAAEVHQHPMVHASWAQRVGRQRQGARSLTSAPSALQRERAATRAHRTGSGHESTTMTTGQ